MIDPRQDFHRGTDLLRNSGNRIISLKRFINAVQQERYYLEDCGYGWTDGFIYFVRSKCDGLIKIGRALNIQKRIKQVESSNNIELELIHFIETDCSSNLETLFHRALMFYRLGGLIELERGREWFNFGKHEDRVIEIISQVTNICYIGIYCNNESYDRQMYEYLLTKPK